jgi:hypothetical protein
MPVSTGRKVTVHVILSSAVEISRRTGSVSRIASANSSETVVTPAATANTASGSAGQDRPVSRRTKAMCGA